MSMDLNDKSVVQALHRLHGADMQPLLTLFKKELAETDKSLRRAADTRFAHLQGKAQWLEEILEAVEKTPSILERFK